MAGQIQRQVEIFNATMRLVSEQMGGLPSGAASIVAQIIRTNIRGGQTDPAAIAAAAVDELRVRGS